MLTSVLGNNFFFSGGVIILAVVFSSVLSSWNLKNRALELRWDKEKKIFYKSLEENNQNEVLEMTGCSYEFYSDN